MQYATDSVAVRGRCTRDRQRKVAVPRTYDRTTGVAVMMLLLSVVAADTTMAQTGTPPAFPSGPEPSECTIEPAPIAEIAAIVATPVAKPTDRATPVNPSTGSTADQETSTEVVETLRQVFACANAGDPLRVASLYTDDFLRDFFGGVPREDLLDFLATPPQPLPEDEKRIIVRLGEVQLLPDGRAGVLIVLDEPDDPRTEEPDYAILKHVEGRWLVDEIHEDGGIAAATRLGTPAA